MEIDKTTEALHRLLRDVKWSPVEGSEIQGELYDTQLHMVIEPNHIKGAKKGDYIEAMVRFFREGMDLVEVSAMDLVPNLFTFPHMHETVEDWTEQFIVKIVNRDPIYAPFMEPEGANPRERFHGMKQVVVRVIFSIVDKGGGSPPALMWVVCSDAYVCDLTMGDNMFRMVQHIETELER